MKSENLRRTQKITISARILQGIVFWEADVHRVSKAFISKIIHVTW